jgi:hypothetical protein
MHMSRDHRLAHAPTPPVPVPVPVPAYVPVPAPAHAMAPARHATRSLEVGMGPAAVHSESRSDDASGVRRPESRRRRREPGSARRRTGSRTHQDNRMVGGQGGGRRRGGANGGGGGGSSDDSEEDATEGAQDHGGHSESSSCVYPGSDQYTVLPLPEPIEVQGKLDMEERHRLSELRLEHIEPIEHEEDFNQFSPISENEPDNILLQRLDLLYRFWQLPEGASDGVFGDLARQFFGFDEPNYIIPPEVDQIWLSRLQLMESLEQEMVRRGLAIDIDAAQGLPSQVEARRQIEVIRDNITTAYGIVSGICTLRSNCSRSGRPIVPPTPLNDAMRLGVDERGRRKQFNDKLRGIKFVLHYCKVNRLGKNDRGDAFLKEIPADDGHHGTHAWKRMGDLTQLVYLAADPVMYPEAWRCIHSTRGTVEAIVKYLQHCRDASFPTIVKDRRIWAFKNGLFNGHQCKFLAWGSTEINDSIVACRYIPEGFDYANYLKAMKCIMGGKNVMYWPRIGTDDVESIFDKQALEPRVRLWTYILFGRLAFRIKELDSWQAQFFLKGVAGTGKSTLLNQLIYLWDPIDVAIISNTMERMFPLEALLNVFVYFGLDISDRFTLDQTLWQSMVSGEGVAVNQKFKSRISVEWDTPGAWAGNRTPPWKDNAGSVSRRLLVILFLVSIAENALKGDLSETMRKTIGAFLMKIIMAYHDIAGGHGLKPIWQMLPDYFRNTRRELGKETNLLSAFLESELVVRGAEYRCPESMFKDTFRWFCQQEKNQPMPNWEASFFGDPFARQSFPIKPQAFRDASHNGKPFRGLVNWLVGVDLRSAVDQRVLAAASVQAAAQQSASDGQANLEATRRRLAAGGVGSAGLPAGGSLPGLASGSVSAAAPGFAPHPPSLPSASRPVLGVGDPRNPARDGPMHKPVPDAGLRRTHVGQKDGFSAFAATPQLHAVPLIQS